MENEIEEERRLTAKDNTFEVEGDGEYSDDEEYVS